MKANKTYTRRKFVGTAIGALVAANLAACGGGGDTAPTPPTSPTTPPTSDTPQTIGLSTTSSRIIGTKPVTLTAALGRSADVTWALGAGSPGTLSATTGASVTYTPPAAAVGAATPVTITATSAGVTATARLALMPDPRQRTGLALLAGSLGGRGLIDGQGTAARFSNIVAMDTDSDGNLVLADLNDTNGGVGQPTLIRVVGPAGNVLTTTPLPFLTYGHADGNVTAAQTGTISGLAAGPNGDIYFVDNDSGARLRMLRAGRITTLQINVAASGVVVDRAGNVYLYSRSQVLRVAADGATSTVLAGIAETAAQADGQGAAARFLNITDATTDAAGNLYVSDDNTVRRITPAGLVTTVAGLAGAARAWVDGTAAGARFGQLLSVSLDNNGNVLALDRLDDAAGHPAYRVRQVTTAGVAGTLYQGAAPPFTGISPANDSPTPVARLRFNSATRTIQLAHVAQIDQLTGGAVQPFAGFEGDSYQEIDGAGDTARFVRLNRLAADLAGNVYTLDFAAPFGGVGDEDAHGLWLRKIAVDGTVTTVVADKDFAFKPNAIVADADGNVFLSARPPRNSSSTSSGGALYKVTPGGVVTLFAGSGAPGTTTSTDGTGSAATFTGPLLEGIDVEGNLYVSDSGKLAKIRKVTPKAVVTTVTALPAGLKVAPNGLVYTADFDRNVVEATDAAGNKTVVVGVAGVPGTRLSALPAGLEHPADIVPTGPNSFAVISGAAVLRLLLPN